MQEQLFYKERESVINKVDFYIRPLNQYNDDVLVWVQFVPDVVSAETAEVYDFEYDLILYTEKMIRSRYAYFVAENDIA